MQNKSSRPRVVVVGGGFGGLHAARALRRAPVDVTLIDRQNYHLFQPLLYQVATGVLSPANIAAPLRSIVRRQKNVTVLLGEVTDFDLENRRVLLGDDAIPYDYLIVAAGATHSHFGHDDWEPLAPGLKSIEDAIDIRARVLSAFEEAERADNHQQQRELLTFVIVGGGPTGVELAGALSELSRHTLKNDFRRIQPDAAKILLIDAEPRLLSMFPEKLSAQALTHLEDLGAQVQLGTKVTDITPSSVTVQHSEGQETIPVATVLWAAGVKASPLGKKLAAAAGCETDRAGRVSVQADVTLSGRPEVFVLGDMAHAKDEHDKPLPGVAPVAIQQGKYVAGVIRNRLAGKATKPFRYHDHGSMATIGRSAAVVDMGKFQFGGLFAWLIWLFLHLVLLVTFQNRLLVLMQWMSSYVTHGRAARLITGQRSAGHAPSAAAEAPETAGRGSE
ncbi:MAG: NAD(P)/FAD-dependent oxidoreductase [Planctomycetales bacterium]|nr:NAD(P)/FAD-dependent oxidoreductase [Planctomycetales bacterium]